MEQHKSCLICNSTDIKPLEGYADNYLVKCGSCGFVFCEKIPTEQELNDFYDPYSRSVSISPITVKRYIEILEAMEPFRKTNNILDVGCGVGHFLDVAKAKGWNVYGTEFTEKAIEVCEGKGIILHRGKLDAANYSPEMFDVITSFEVIEHINNPQEEMAEVKKILRSGGLFYVTTPNFNSISRWKLGPKWNVIHYPEHLSYYTARTMNKFMKSQGFSKKKLETTGISVKRYKQSTASTSDESVNNADEALREKIETRLTYKILKHIINAILNCTKRGDGIKAYYVKQ